MSDIVERVERVASDIRKDFPTGGRQAKACADAAAEIRRLREQVRVAREALEAIGLHTVPVDAEDTWRTKASQWHKMRGIAFAALAQLDTPAPAEGASDDE